MPGEQSFKMSEGISGPSQILDNVYRKDWYVSLLIRQLAVGQIGLFLHYLCIKDDQSME